MSIVAGLYNQDSSFFEVTSPDISDRVMEEDIISFNYTEEMSKYNTGSLVMNDPDHFYSKILRLGARLDVSFGYGKSDISKQALLLSKQNPEQVFGGNARTGIKGRIISPSGSGSSSGVVTFNCNFYGSEYLQNKNYRVHVGLTKGALVSQLLLEIGCSVIEVNFTRMNELLNLNTQIFQRETNYKLLNRFAREWRALFRISYNSLGQMTALFISPSYLGAPSIAPLMSGAIGGSTIFLEYKQGVSNVLEYTWKNQIGDSGSGDNTRIIYGANGQPTFVRYVTTTESVKVYKLNTQRIKDKVKTALNQSKGIALMKEYLTATDFEQVKWAFDLSTETTAPQGLGYSLDAKIMGVPMFSAPISVLFGEGFPVWFTPQNPSSHIVKYYCRKINHSIDRSGYKCDLEIMDGFTLTGGSLI